LGIVSTNPAIVIGPDSGNSVAVALNGRVPVKIDPASPAINIGDYVTSSGAPGMAMKATKAGQVIGKALESWTPDSGKSTIMVFVNLSWYDPQAYLDDASQFVISVTEQDSNSTSTPTIIVGNASGTVLDNSNTATTPTVAAIGQNPISSASQNTTLSQNNYQIVGSDKLAITRVGVFSDLVAGSIRAGSIDAQEISISGVSLQDYLKNFLNSSSATSTSAIALDDIGDVTATASATSTEDFVSATWFDQLTQAVKNILQSLGLFIENGVATLKELTVDKFTAKQADIEQIQNDQIQTKQVQTEQMCISGTDNETVCVTKDQLKQLLNTTGTSMMTTKVFAPADGLSSITVPPAAADATSTVETIAPSDTSTSDLTTASDGSGTGQ
jgi:hypothetical protein